jgi:histidinol-phosphatase
MLDLKLCLTEARDAVAEGAALALKSFRTRFSVRLKADRTPGDGGRRRGRGGHPHAPRAPLSRHRVLRRGERRERQRRVAHALDPRPIDGTENFIAGIPIFATLLGLEHDGQIVLGVVEAPAMRERAWAVRGEGAWLNGERIHVSSCTDLRQAFLVYGSSGDFVRHAAIARGESSWPPPAASAASAITTVTSSWPPAAPTS